MTRLSPSLRGLASPKIATIDARPDEILLARFISDRDSAAFATLVGRYTPAIRAVCGAWLRSRTDIDDAAQATFLVLVRRADSIRDASKLGPWLCKVARYVAQRLRKDLRRTEPLLADPPNRLPPTGSDEAELVAEEVERLPEKYRVPVLMHYSAGLSTAEIAEQLGCPKGTVLTRLDRGRKLLERRLSARGWPAAALLVAAVARPLSAAWVLATARGAALLVEGQAPLSAGVSTRSVSLTEGVVRTMTATKLRYAALVLMVATGLGGFALGQFGSKPTPKPLPDPIAQKPEPKSEMPKADIKAEEPKPAKVDDAKPGNLRRREAVIKMPVGTFVKDVDAGEYGSGRLTWTFEDDTVRGVIEANVMGIEVELRTEAEFSLSSNGTIYGIVTSAEVTHLKIGAGLGEGAAEYAKFVKLAEPLLNEMLTDLPFSYQFRINGDKLTILNYRTLLAGPNPLGKLGGLFVSGNDRSLQAVGAFQAIGLAMEGTYTAGDAPAADKPRAKPILRKATPKKTAEPVPRGQGMPIPVQRGAIIGRAEVLKAESEDLRQMSDEMKRFWNNDQPSHLTPERIHGASQ